MKLRFDVNDGYSLGRGWGKNRFESVSIERTVYVDGRWLVYAQV